MSQQDLGKTQQFVGFCSFVKPAVAAANAGACTLVSDVAISGTTAQTLTVAAQNDYPRTVRVWITDANASLTSVVVTVTGIDQNGVGITDTITCTAAGATNGAKAFAYITSISSLATGTLDAGSDKIAVGYGPALGLQAAPNALYSRLIKGTFDGGDEAGTFSTTYGLYTPAGTMDGKKAVEVLFQYKLLANW